MNINFEEEIAKFEPSLDIDQAEDAIYHNDMADVTDIIKEILKDIKSN